MAVIKRALFIVSRCFATQSGPAPPPIRVGITQSAGRGVYATRDIKYGEVIHTAEPMVAHPSLTKLNKVCYFCLRRLVDVNDLADGAQNASLDTHAVNSLQVKFCGRECEQSAHSFYAIEKKASWRTLHQFCRERNLRAPLLAKRLICMVVSGMVGTNVLDILSFAHVQDADQSWKLTRNLILDSLKDSGVPEKDLAFASAEWYFGILTRISLNSFRIELLLEEEVMNVLAAAVESVSGEGSCGTAVYVLPSMYNHDCDPNVDVSWPSNSILRLSARREIQEGEELRITYIDASMSRSSRQKLLQEAYSFQCNCARCKDED